MPHETIAQPGPSGADSTLALSPQQCIDESLATAHVCQAAALTTAHGPRSAGTADWPFALSPQQSIDPGALMAHVWLFELTATHGPGRRSKKPGPAALHW